MAESRGQAQAKEYLGQTHRRCRPRAAASEVEGRSDPASRSDHRRAQRRPRRWRMATALRRRRPNDLIGVDHAVQVIRRRRRRTHGPSSALRSGLCAHDDRNGTQDHFGLRPELAGRRQAAMVRACRETPSPELVRGLWASSPRMSTGLRSSAERCSLASAPEQDSTSTAKPSPPITSTCPVGEEELRGCHETTSRRMPRLWTTKAARRGSCAASSNTTPAASNPGRAGRTQAVGEIRCASIARAARDMERMPKHVRL